METFLYRELNRANREKDMSKVDTLGPITFALEEVNEYESAGGKGLGHFKCYRGVKLTKK